MTESSGDADIARATAEIVKAFLEKKDVAAGELPALVREVRLALGGEPAGSAARSEREQPALFRVPALEGLAEAASKSIGERAAPTPPVPIAESITPQYLISL